MPDPDAISPERSRPRPRLRLAARLTLAFTLVLLPLLVVVLLAGSHLRRMQDQSNDLIDRLMPRLLAMQELVEHAQGHGAAMARLLTAPRTERESIYPALDAESAAIDKLIDVLSQGTPNDGDRQRLAAMDAARQHYRGVFAAVGEGLESGDRAGAAALFAAQGQPALAALIAQARALRAAEQHRLILRQATMAARIRQAEWQLAALSLAGLGLAGALGWRTTRGIAVPMHQLAQAARALAAGDYRARVQVRAAVEIERVASALNGMADAVAGREAEIARIAYVDRVTGLPNRAAIRQRLADTPDASHVVLVLDLARLGMVNDVLGYAAGNALLRAAATQLASNQALQANWTLGCLGGGVFVLAGHGVAAAAGETRAVELTRMKTLSIAPQAAPVDLQFVAGLAAGGSELDADRLLRHAEQAVADAKARRVAWAWHVALDPVLRERQIGLLSGLRQAAADGSLAMWLQPKCRCVANADSAPQVEGFEALVRWQHPQWGWVSPADFVPFAERAGHVHLITEAMLEAALRQLAAWQHHHRHWTIAVNVSTADLLDPDFDTRLIARAQRCGAPLQRLRLEITESRLMQDAERVLAMMHSLGSAGVQWSIDDFGTGYSSLAYLQRLPVSELKIDRSFVTDADRSNDRRTLLRTIIELARGLRLTVTAEGVERPGELALLAELGCDGVQGFLLAQPMPALQAEAFALGSQAVGAAAAA